jgi:hypothetical protein
MREYGKIYCMDDAIRYIEKAEKVGAIMLYGPLSIHILWFPQDGKAYEIIRGMKATPPRLIPYPAWWLWTRRKMWNRAVKLYIGCYTDTPPIVPFYWD